MKPPIARQRKNGMSEPEDHLFASAEPTVVSRRRNWLPSLIWLIPIVAALVGVTLVAQAS